MAKMQFKDKKFSGDALAIVTTACGIMDEYEGMGYKLSLRQLYYQLVSKNIVPNTEASYNRVGCIISDARLAGLCDWEMIEDRGRETQTVPHWNHPGEIIDACARSYRIDKWGNQPGYCEVMVEKQALEGILEPVCRELDIPFTANKGYSSQTMMYHTGRRLRLEFLNRAIQKGLVPSAHQDTNRSMQLAAWMQDQEIIEAFKDGECRLTKKGLAQGWPVIRIFYLGDHDPSGIDMTRDVQQRLKVFSDYMPIEIHRLALNIDQVQELNPPENPAKTTDSRAADYIRRFGNSSWELDAVAPDALAQIVREAVESFRSEGEWNASVEREEEERKRLQDMAQNWDKPPPASPTKSKPKKPKG
jgi:hypothetical protein